jgi:hypothetical protein
MAMEKVEQSLSEYERRCDLRGMVNVLKNGTSQEEEIARLLPLIKSGSVREDCLVLEIVANACKRNMEIGESFVEVVLKRGSLKLANGLVYWFVVLAGFNLDQFSGLIQPLRLDLIAPFSKLHCGLLLTLLPRKHELFAALVGYLDEYLVNSAPRLRFSTPFWCSSTRRRMKQSL